MAIVSVVAMAAIGGAYLFLFKDGERYQKLEVSRLPNSRGIRAAISPDGKYLVYVETQAGQASLKLRQLATHTDIELIPRAQIRYRFMQFSGDGNYIYYSAYPVAENSNPESGGTSIYKIPKIGGSPIKLIENLQLIGNSHQNFSLSRDGKKLAFHSKTPEANALLITDEDGGNETVILTRPPHSYYDHLAWSPDGKMVAFVTWEGIQRKNLQVVAVEVDSKTEKQLSAQLWAEVYGLNWVADGSGLVMAALIHGVGAQLWHIDYPGGESRRISADENTYISLMSMTADSRVIACTVMNNLSSLWVVTDGDGATAEEIKGRSSFHDPVWTPDGQIVFHSGSSGNLDIWIMQSDGTNQRQLTVNEAIDESPAVSPDGRYIVFQSNRAGAQNLWRINLEGGNPVRLTKGKSDISACFSPDGKWIIYVSLSNEPTIWKVPVDGGEPVQLTREFSLSPAISPDGKQIACLWKDDKPNSIPQIALLPFAGGEPTKILDVQANGPIQWTEDGQAVIFSSREKRHLQHLDATDRRRFAKTAHGLQRSYPLKFRRLAGRKKNRLLAHLY